MPNHSLMALLLLYKGNFTVLKTIYIHIALDIFYGFANNSREEGGRNDERLQ